MRMAFNRERFGDTHWLGPGGKDYWRLQKGKVKIEVKYQGEKRESLHSLLLLHGVGREVTGCKGCERLSTHPRALSQRCAIGRPMTDYWITDGKRWGFKNIKTLPEISQSQGLLSPGPAFMWLRVNMSQACHGVRVEMPGLQQQWTGPGRKHGWQSSHLEGKTDP